MARRADVDGVARVADLGRRGPDLQPREIDQVLDDAKGRKAKELVQEYVRREPDAVTQVLELLTDAGVSMDGLMADALAKKLDAIERIDRLISIAATTACARSSGVGRSSAKRCDGACKKSRTANLK